MAAAFASERGFKCAPLCMLAEQRSLLNQSPYRWPSGMGFIVKSSWYTTGCARAGAAAGAVVAPLAARRQTSPGTCRPNARGNIKLRIAALGRVVPSKCKCSEQKLCKTGGGCGGQRFLFRSCASFYIREEQSMIVRKRQRWPGPQHSFCRCCRCAASHVMRSLRSIELQAAHTLPASTVQPHMYRP